MLPQPPFLARPVLTTMGANMAGEEYTPTLTEGGSPQASPQSEPPGPGMERGASPVLESPAFSPEDGFGPDALNAQPRSNPPAPPSAPPQPAPSPTPGVDPSPEEGDDWGPEWPGEAPSKRLRSAGAASGSEAPAYGIPGNVPPGSLSPPLGGLSFQEQLWIRALTAEADRRWKEAEEVGLVRGPLPVNEPRPLLSHFFGIPENVADMWDSVSAAVNIPGHLLRALGNPSGLTGVAIGPPGIPRPSEFGDPTPPLAKATAAFPEEPFRKPLMVEAATQTTEGETAWNQWLAKARVGKGLAEHGLRTSDFEVSKRIAECMPPLSAARESRLRDRRNHPDSMAVMLYIIHAESSYLSYRRAPRGYSDLLGGLEAKMLQPPANVWEKEVAQAWKILEASVVFRMAGVRKRADEKKARREGRASLRSATAKAAASDSARLPSTSASSSEEEACTLQLEIEAMNHVVGVQDGRMWRSLEDMVGYSRVIQYWPCGRSRASLFRGPGGNLGAPFAQESGGGVNGAVGGPGDDIFNLPRVPSPSVFRAYGVQAPPPVPKRSRLPTPPRAPGEGASAASSVPPTATGPPMASAPSTATGQTEREKSFKLPAPSPTPPSTSSPSVPAETYESLTENAFPDFQTVAAGAREAIRSGREALDEESSELE